MSYQDHFLAIRDTCPLCRTNSPDIHPHTSYRSHRWSHTQSTRWEPAPGTQMLCGQKLTLTSRNHMQNLQRNPEVPRVLCCFTEWWRRMRGCSWHTKDVPSTPGMSQHTGDGPSTPTTSEHTKNLLSTPGMSPAHQGHSQHTSNVPAQRGYPSTPKMSQYAGNAPSTTGDAPSTPEMLPAHRGGPVRGGHSSSGAGGSRSRRGAGSPPWPAAYHGLKRQLFCQQGTARFTPCATAGLHG